MAQTQDPFESAQTFVEVDIAMVSAIAKALKNREPQKIIRLQYAGLRALDRIENTPTN